MTKFNIPKTFKCNDVIPFLNEIQEVFSWRNKLVPNIHIDIGKTKTISSLGILLIYKIIEFTYKNYCFKRPNLIANDYILQKWKEYGFYELISAYMDDHDKTEQIYRKLAIKMEDKFFIAPQALLRGDQYSKDVLEKNFLPQIKSYYSESEKVVSMIFLCISEILLNFWEHAVEDTKSILVVEGNKQNIEITCADTGNGIISTLGVIYKEFSLSKTTILRKSIEKGQTSKKMSNHMGYGLWILNEITTQIGGRLHLYSEGAYLKNERKKILTGECGYWQGTIIYLSLPLQNPKTLSDIDPYTISDEININIG